MMKNQMKNKRSSQMKNKRSIQKKNQMMKNQDDDEDEVWFDEDALEIISHELWRKTMRFKDDTPYYNVDKDYISQHVEEYFYYQDYEQEEEEKEPIDVMDEPDDNEYGGFWYRKIQKSRRFDRVLQEVWICR